MMDHGRSCLDRMGLVQLLHLPGMHRMHGIIQMMDLVNILQWILPWVLKVAIGIIAKD